MTSYYVIPTELVIQELIYKKYNDLSNSHLSWNIGTCQLFGHTIRLGLDGSWMMPSLENLATESPRFHFYFLVSLSLKT